MRRAYGSRGASLLSRRDFLKWGGAVCLSRSLLAEAVEKPPNIVLIVADDLGYGDLGCFGGLTPTPNIDQLAGSGIRFTRAYSAAPMCSASRAALLTGRYAQRLGVPALSGVVIEGSLEGLPNVTEDGKPVIAIADILRSKGYRTACIGKWHLGHADEKFLPLSHGFDKFKGFPYSNNMRPLPYLDGTQIVDMFEDKKEQLTDRITLDAIGFIAEARERPEPFFLYLAYTAPHEPLALSGNSKGRSGAGDYPDTIMELDRAVGDVMHALGENTLIIFASDNGAPYDPLLDMSKQGSNGELTGGKFSTFDGGIRIPLIISYPERISGGQTCGELVSLLDIPTTLGMLAGFPVQYVDPDGVDLWPYLKGDADHVERSNSLLVFRFDSLECAIRRLPDRDGIMRLFKIRTFGNAARSELFDLETDPAERINVASQFERIVEGMEREMGMQLATFPDLIQKSNRI